jgi:hypothetical protein
MDCPACHTDSQPGQKSCAVCGHDLEMKCPSCGATNPPGCDCCHGCGKNLETAGTIVLVRSGLIADIDQGASTLLGRTQKAVVGKPFSLFVDRDDLPIFFSHWNELINSRERQTFELALKNGNGNKIQVIGEWTQQEHPTESRQFHLSLTSAGNGTHRSAMHRLRRQQELLHLIYSLSDSVRTASNQHQAAAVDQGLKKICGFLQADHCFVYAIDRRQKRLRISHQWPQPAGPEETPLARIVPLNTIKRSVARLRQERAYIIDDVSQLPLEERNGIETVFFAPPAKLMAQLIHTHRRPIAIVGAAGNHLAGKWDADDAALIKLFGQLIYDMPSLAAEDMRPASTGTEKDHRGGRRYLSPVAKTPDPDRNPAERLNREKINATHKSPPRNDGKPLPTIGAPLQLERSAGVQSIARQRVYIREDGQILLACSHCGLQESVSTARFEMLGNAVTVRCTCGNQFGAVLEKRCSMRKAVQLEGYFTVAGEHDAEDTKGNVWGPMVVKSLSKSGLRFYSPRGNLIDQGDLLMVRFNLNNSSKALVHKKAQVVSIRNNEIGCRFEGADEYDVTLGFYFM